MINHWLIYSVLLVGFTAVAQSAEDCNASTGKFNPQRFCEEQKLAGDLLACAETAKEFFSPSATVDVLELCQTSNETCLQVRVEYIVGYRLQAFYSELLAYLSKREVGNNDWINNAIATLYIMRAEGNDLLRAEEILTPLAEVGYRTAIGNMASLKHLQEKYNESIKMLEELKNNEELFYDNYLHVIQYAQHYHFGSGVERDLPYAKKLYEQALGSSTTGELEYLLSDIYLEMEDISHSIKLLKQSSAKGFYKSAEMLASFYLTGINVEKDYKKSLSYFKIASRLGSPTAIANQGIIYSHLGEMKKSRIAFISAALINDSTTAHKVLLNEKIDPEIYRCQVLRMFGSPSNFLFQSNQ
ncbi:hypothetical protein VT06_04950 [Arsukibacterium sp. MJ3]|uniref:tetratricopeptide repeat protein n=1 Tax=Arsukibacterium sp. MJ3 TaxID=1632859 RepID=UPI000626FF3E|nr:tetratricopeptide repeat protein [Arsukibacterium sp. MJ3]KKO49555.1 hypothetical protein VT06_04950 [Arsukibacterium sp. MJ3]